MNITGLDDAPSIPAGATVTDATWHVAELYGPSLPFESERDAIAAGIADRADRELVNRAARYPSEGAAYLPLPERFSIDLRWRMEFPDGGATEFTVRRTTYDTLADAREHLARIDYFNPPRIVMSARS